MTRGELVTAVMFRLGYSTDDVDEVAQIQTQLNQEYLRVVLEEHLNTSSTTLVFTADDPLVTLPSDLVAIKSISVGDKRLEQINRERLHDLTAGGTTTVEADTGPAVYSFEAPGRIRVWPAPATNDLDGATVYYDARPDPLNDDADVPDAIPDEFHDLLTELVVARIAATREEAFDIAAIAKGQADELRGRLRRHIRDRMGIGDYHLRRLVYSAWRRR